MSKARLIVVSVMGLLVSGPVAFADPPQTPAPAASSNSDLDAIVCRAGEAPIGTRLPGPRVCHSQKEWNQIQQDSARQVQYLQSGVGQKFPGN